MMMALNIRTLVVAGILGVALTVAAGSIFAAQSGNTRPGWGYGDKNHVHTGPPGQSVRPTK